MKKLLITLAAALMMAQPALAYELAGGVLTIDNGSDPLLGLDKTQVKKIVVAEGVTALGSGLLSGCSAAESIELPPGLTVIGDEALAGCASLTSVKLPEGTVRVESRAFKDCSFLRTVIVPPSVTHIADNAFSSPVKIYGFSNSFGAAFAKRRIYRRNSLGADEIIKEVFDFQSIDGCNIRDIQVYPSGVPKVNYFRSNTLSSPVTANVGWLSQPDVYGIITILLDNQFFWTDSDGVRFDSYFDARDAHRANQYTFVPDTLSIVKGMGLEYDSISGFRNNLAVVGKDGYYGVYDATSSAKPELSFTEVQCIGGEVFLQKDNKLYSRTMNSIPEGTWLDRENCFGGRFMLRNRNGMFGFADEKLSIAVPLEYNRIPWGASYPFRDNSETACLAIDDKLVLVDKNGNQLLYFN